MNYVDLIIVLVVAIGAIWGAFKGLIRQLGSLVGFVLGIILSRVFGEELSVSLCSMCDMPATVGSIVAHILIFVVVYIVCVLVFKLIRSLAHKVAMGWIDRLGGLLFGALKWFFAISLLLNLLLTIDPSGKIMGNVPSSSRGYEYALKFAPLVFSVAQEQLLDETKEHACLFISGEGDDNALLCSENCKED